MIRISALPIQRTNCTTLPQDHIDNQDKNHTNYFKQRQRQCPEPGKTLEGTNRFACYNQSETQKKNERPKSSHLHCRRGQENPKRFDNKSQIDAKIRARTTILRVRGLETVEV